MCLQMEEVLERLSAQEKEIAPVGTTVVQTEQLLKDLEMLDKHAQVIPAHMESFKKMISLKVSTKEFFF